jgi:NhaP-type Na+/H+ or K+/H+ antiporter
VVAALSQLGAPKKLSTLVEGESLLNDGSAVVCFLVLLDWSSAPNDDKFCAGDPPSAGCVVSFFCQVAIGGTAVGVIMATIMFFWIKYARARQFPTLDIAIVFTAIYSTFFLAEALRTSGVLATVTLGFLVSAGISKRMSHDGRHNHHVILCQCCYFCNQVAFFTAGIVSARFMYSSNAASCDHIATNFQAWVELGGLYICIHVTRALVVACFWPFLKTMGYGITWKEACILVYGGLRGAVGMVMGLIVEHNQFVNPATAQMIAFHTSGIVLLTLFINGSTIDGLYKNLDLYPKNEYRVTHLRKVLLKLETECHKTGVAHLCRDWFFHDCLFKKMLRCMPNFNHLSFDAAGVPTPEHIEPVKVTLKSLAELASAHDTKGEHFKRMSSYAEVFSAQWKDRKIRTEDFLAELLHATSDIGERKDAMINVANHGDRVVQYSPPEQKAAAGFYISVRSLQDLVVGHEI